MKWLFETNWMKGRLYFENPINLVLISAMKFFLPLSCLRRPHRQLVILVGRIRYRADSSGYTRRTRLSFSLSLSMNFHDILLFPFGSPFLACYLFHIFSSTTYVYFCPYNFIFHCCFLNTLPSIYTSIIYLPFLLLSQTSFSKTTISI